MASRIWPTENDVHDVTGGGRKPTEENLTNFRRAATPQISQYRHTSGAEGSTDSGGCISGFDFSSGSATSVTLTAGTATIEGFYIDRTTTISGTLVANQFNYVFLTLDKTASLVTGISLTVESVATFNAAITIPADSILLWCFETDGASIITQFDFRTSNSNAIYGFYIGDGAATRTINLGFRPKLVQVTKNEEPRWISQSPLAEPRGSGQQRGVIWSEAQLNMPMFGHFTNDSELVPIITEDGFVVEDGPGTLACPVYGEGTLGPTGNFSIAGNTTRVDNVTVVGAQPGDACFATFDNILSEVNISVEITALDTASVRLGNASSSATSLMNGNYKVGVFMTSIDLIEMNELNSFYYFIAWF